MKAESAKCTYRSSTSRSRVWQLVPPTCGAHVAACLRSMLAYAEGCNMRAGVLKEYSRTVPVGKLPLEYVTVDTPMDAVSS